MKSRELVNQWCEEMGRSIDKVISFPAGEDFEAIHKAEAKVSSLGYRMGSMCRDEPIALSNNPNITYVAKWKNIERKEWKKIDGLIVSDDMRNGDVSIVIFAK